ncbi:MAG: hypothetical protein ABSD46_05585 [Bacteroidota bacterium]
MKFTRILVIGILAVIVSSCTKKSAESKQPAVVQRVMVMYAPSDSLKRKFLVPIQVANKAKEVNEDTLLGPLAEADTAISGSPANKVSIQASEVVLQDSAGSSRFQLTYTGGNIDTLFVSPNCKYVACMQILEWVNEPGEYDDSEKVPQRPVYQIVFINLVSRSIIREIPPEDPLPFWVFEKWISNSRALISTTEGFSVGRVYVYDAFRDSLQYITTGTLGGTW